MLATEAAAQRDPTNAQRWFELGVKQQENEREQKAVQALRRALELEPSHLPSWLALAISYTNESNRRGAYYAIREWVDRNELYRPVVEQFRALNPEAEDMVQSDRLANLVQCLIEAARSDTSGAIDADLQIALAVLLNTSEVNIVLYRTAGALFSRWRARAILAGLFQGAGLLHHCAGSAARCAWI